MAPSIPALDGATVIGVQTIKGGGGPGENAGPIPMGEEVMTFPKAAPKPTKAAAKPKAPAHREAGGVIKRATAYNIDPKMIVRRKDWNPRFDFGEIGLLAKSIEANGLLMPIRVKRVEGKFELIDGDRRFTAIEKLLKKGHKFPEGIMAVIEDKGIEDLDALVTMFEANTGKPFLPLEEAAAYKRMQDGGLSIKKICERIGKAERHVRQMLDLLNADEDVKDAVKSGKIGKQTAKDIATKAKGNKEKQKELTRKAVSAEGSRVAKRAVKEAIHGPAKKKAAPPEQGSLRLRAKLVRTLTVDCLKVLEESTRASVESNLKELGLKDGSEVSLATRSQKILYMQGLADALHIAQSETEQDAHDAVAKLFTKHGIVR